MSTSFFRITHWRNRLRRCGFPFTPRKATPYFGYGYQFWLFPGEKRRFALLGVYGQSIFVDPELKLVMVITAAAKNASVGKEPFARERDALWRGVVGKYGSWSGRSRWRNPWHKGVVMRSLLIGLIGLVSLAVSPALAADAATQEANKKVVLEFYDAALNRKDFDAAAKYFGPHYIQHNPTAPDGIEGFKGFLGFLREKFPDSRSEIKRAFADGDYVILHVHSVREKGTRGRAIVDIFRLENGKIVEHWDVVQDIPEKAANTNGMF